MLNMWDDVDTALASHICDLHYSLTGDRLDPTKVKVLQSTIPSPYPGYVLLRLEISPHIIEESAPEETFTLSARAVSYLLYSVDTQLAPFRLIPLHRSTDAIYALNEMLGFRLTSG